MTIALLVVLILFAALAAVLVAVLLGLSRELQRLDTDTERLQVRMRRKMRQFQAAAPVLMGLRNLANLLQTKRTSVKQRKKQHEKKD